MSRNNPLLILLVAALALAVAACSTTKRIPEGELLYTGVKKITINTASPDEKLDPVLESAGMIDDFFSAANDVMYDVTPIEEACDALLQKIRTDYF